MQKLIIVLAIFVSVLSADRYITPAERYCKTYKDQAVHYYNLSQKRDYLYERYIYLYKDFKWKYDKCIEEYSNGNYYQGYKQR
jgi:hypothetical protein